MSSTRRSFLSGCAASAAWALGPAPRLRANVERDEEPHVFLQLFYWTGLDATYWFDARPLALTAAGLLQNYDGREPFRWEGRNGQATLASELVRPLLRHKDRLAVVNGVLMAPDNDGHEANYGYCQAGTTATGPHFVPAINCGTPPAPLDFVQVAGDVPVGFTNTSSGVQLTTASAVALTERLRSAAPLRLDSPLYRHLARRLAAAGAGDGLFARGARELDAAFAQAEPLNGALRNAEIVDGGAPFASSLNLAMQYLRIGAARSALMVMPDRLLDVHAPQLARKLPGVVSTMVDDVALTLDTLASTPFDATRSFLDVTTVMVVSEMSRTMRQLGVEGIEFTGTDHNPLTNTVLLAGKGIRGGTVLGASDFQTPDETLSAAHLQKDAARLRIIGRPFDFERFAPASVLPDEFRPGDYLTINSVINTIYAALGVPEASYRSATQIGGRVPVLTPLLT
jgi:uncharacterized protein (DUF1501 family)